MLARICFVFVFLSLSSSRVCRDIRDQPTCISNTSCVWCRSSNIPESDRCNEDPLNETVLDTVKIVIPPYAERKDITLTGENILSIDLGADGTAAFAGSVPYSASPIQQWYLIGGKGGIHFSFYNKNEYSVIKIEAWSGPSSLRGVKIHLNSGRSYMGGVATDRYCGSITLDVDNGEYINYLSVWGNGAGTRTGAFRIKTNKGQDWLAKMYKWGLKTEYHFEVGSGIMLGMFGNAGNNEMYSFGFLMLRKIIGTDMRDVEYDMKGDNLQPPVLKTSLDTVIANPSQSDTSGYYKVTKSHVTGGKWSVTAGVKFGQKYSVKGGVPLVAKGSKETSWEVSISGTYESTWSDSTTFEQNIPLICPKLTKTKFTVKYYEGQSHRLPFKATMTYLLDNGGTFVTKVSGVYDGVDNTQFVQNTSLVARWDDSYAMWVPVNY